MKNEEILRMRELIDNFEKFDSILAQLNSLGYDLKLVKIET